MDYTLDDLRKMTGKEVEDLFYGSSHQRQNKPLPDYKRIYQRVKNKKIKTNLYFEWLEYKKTYPDGYQYTQFKHYFKVWMKENHLSSELSMAVSRNPGEIVYIDWIGDTLDIVRDSDDPSKMLTAHFFATTVGVSSYCFAEAFPNEQLPCFIQGTVDAINFYGAVPRILKPDNVKTAVIKNTRDKLVLNDAYEDLQNFYNTVVVPAPPLKPKGKPTVENHVRWLETHLLERLRANIFSSFSDLNARIEEIMEELNSRKMTKENGSRKQLFEDYDKPAMKPLPKDSFTVYDYVTRTVPSNYHVEYDKHYYSLPYTYYKSKVTVKASFFDIIIVDSMNHLICSHARSYNAYPKYITKPEHMPSNHSYYYTENRYDGEAYRSWARKYGNEMYVFISRLLASFPFEEQAYKSCNAALQACKGVPRSLVAEAAAECIRLNTYSQSYFRKNLNVLSSGNKEKSSSDDVPEHSNIRGKDRYR